MDEDQNSSGNSGPENLNYSVMSHGPKVISPSAEFVDEMAKEDHEPVVVGNMGPTSGPEAADTPEAEPKPTPQAIQDYLSSEPSANSATAEAPVAAMPTEVASSPANSINSTTPLASAPANSNSNLNPSNGLHPVTGQPLVPSEPPERKRGWKKWTAIAVIVLVVLAAGAAFAYHWELNRPTNVVKEALANTLAAKSVSLNGEMKVNLNNPSISYTTTLSGAYATGGPFQAKISTSAGGASLGAQALSPDGQNFYFQLSGLDNLPKLMQGLSGPTGGASTDPAVQSALGLFGPMLAPLNNQWVEVSQNFIKQAGSKGFSSSFELTSADQSQLKQAYLANPFLVIKDILPDQSVGGTDSFHYQITVDKEKLVAFLNQVNNDHIAKVKISSAEIKTISGYKDSDFTSQPIDLYISKSSRQITEIALQRKFNNGLLNVSLDFSHYNQPVNIAAPKGAKQIQALLEGVNLGGASTQLLQQNSAAASFEQDVLTVMATTNEYISNNNGQMPAYITQSGNTVKICSSSACSGASDTSAQLTSGAKVSLSSTLPTSDGQIVVMPNEQCTNNQLSKGSNQDVAVAYYADGTLGCQQD